MKKTLLAVMTIIVVAFATQTIALAAPQRYSENYVLGIAKDCDCTDPNLCQCIPCGCGEENCEHYGQYLVINEFGEKVRSTKPDNVDRVTKHKQDFLAGEVGIDYQDTPWELKITGGWMVLIMLALLGVLAIVGTMCKGLVASIKGIRKFAKKTSKRRKVSTAPKGVAKKPASKKHARARV